VYEVSYGNIALCAVSRGRILRELRRLGRRAYVSPAQCGITVVYDEVCDIGRPQEVEALAATVTGCLRCPALSFVVREDILFVCSVADEGELRARYVWSRPDASPQCGVPDSMGSFAQEACSALRTEVPEELEQILGSRRRIDPQEERRTRAFGVHVALTQVLQVPYSAILGYVAIDNGAATAPDRFVRV